jgi:hypothetical protein
MARLKSWTCRVDCSHRVQTWTLCSLTHIRGEEYWELVRKVSRTTKDAMRIVRLVIASRLCRDTGVIVIKQISTFVFAVALSEKSRGMQDERRYRLWIASGLASMLSISIIMKM